MDEIVSMRIYVKKNDVDSAALLTFHGARKIVFLQM